MSSSETVKDLPALWKPADAAAFLGVQPSTVYMMVRTRTIPHIRVGPRLIRFDRETLRRWVAKGGSPSEA